MGGEQARELLGLGELALVAAVRAVDVGQAVLGEAAVLGLVRLLQVVGAEALVAGGALGQRVAERGDVTGGDPHLGGEDHRGVETDDLVTGGDHVAPPLALDVLLELDAQRSVVPGGALATVDLAARVDEATALAQADDAVDLVGGHGALFITTKRLVGPPGLTCGRGPANTSDYRRPHPRDQIRRSADGRNGAMRAAARDAIGTSGTPALRRPPPSGASRVAMKGFFDNRFHLC